MYVCMYVPLMVNWSDLVNWSTGVAFSNKAKTWEGA